MAGQRAQISFRSDPFRVGTDLGWLDFTTRYRRVRSEQCIDALRPFLGLERAGAINEGAAGLEHIDRGAQQILLNDSKPRDVLRRFAMRYVGVPANRTGRVARSIEE